MRSASFALYNRLVRILVVEDEVALAERLSAALALAGYVVDCAADGVRAEFLGRTEAYDAVILDLGLPGMDGLTLLQQWRDAGVGTPVIVLTARATWHERVLGIDSGADDYVTKPFQMEEVLARLRALIRRASGQISPALRCGALVLEPRASRVTLNGLPLRLTTHEFRVLSYLMHHQDRIVSQTELAEHIYARDEDRDSNTVEVFVARLRKKVGATAIVTVRGRGYRMERW
jgi:two-component system OmpR family response regulator